MSIVSAADMFAGRCSLLDARPSLEAVGTDAALARGRRVRHHLASRRGPPEQDIVNVRVPAGHSVAIGIEEVSWIRLGRRSLPEGDVISKASASCIACGGDIDQEVAPEAHNVVLIVSVATVLQRESYL